MKIACIQVRSSPNVTENLDLLEPMVAEAAKRGAIYVQTPEMTSFVAQNPKKLFANIEPDEGSYDDDLNSKNSVVNFAANLAKKYRIWLHLGSIAVRAGNIKAANRALLFSPDGQRIAQYDKLHMFDVDLPNKESWRESSHYQPGDKAIVVKTDLFSLGMSICYDLRFSALYHNQARAGAQILTCPAAFTRQTGEVHWHVLLRARAIENGAFMIAAAQGGEHEDGRHTYGHSLIINPWGEIISELDHDEPGILVCDIDLTQVETARSRIPNLSNNTNYTTITVSGN